MIETRGQMSQRESVQNIRTKPIILIQKSARLIIKMNKKLQTIRTLKSKLAQIQQHLQSIIHPIKPLASPSTNPSPVRKPINYSHGQPFHNRSNLPSNNHNMEKQDFMNCTQKVSSTYHSSPYFSANSTNFLQAIHNEYCQSAPQSVKNAKSASYFLQKQLNCREERFYKKNRSPPLSECKSKESTPRFEKVQKQSIRPNLILNPEPQKQKGKRIVRQACRSPENVYIKNMSPCLGRDTQPACLSPKVYRKNLKNNSPNVREVLSSSLEFDSRRKISKGGKKHYHGHLKETFACQWA